MTKLRFNLAISLDGYLAGPDQSVDHPLGVGGMHLEQVRVIEAPGVTHIKYRVIR